MDEYSNDDFTFDLLAGIFSEQDRIFAEEGEAALMVKVDKDLMLVGSLLLSLNESGYTDTVIYAEIHMRQYTGQGFTHISFEDDNATD